MTEQEERRKEREKLREKYKKKYDQLSELLFRHDPIGIAFIGHDQVADNPDEYEPEVGTILPRLRDCSSEADCLKVIHEEFSRWFGGEAGPISHYKKIAHETWIMWNGT